MRYNKQIENDKKGYKQGKNERIREETSDGMCCQDTRRKKEREETRQ